MYRCANIHVFADSSLPADYAVIFVEAASLNILPDGKIFKPHLCRLRSPNCLIPSPFLPSQKRLGMPTRLRAAAWGISLNVLPDGKIFKPHLCRLRGPNCLIPSPFSAFIECFAFEKTPRDAFALTRCGMGYKSE